MVTIYLAAVNIYKSEVLTPILEYILDKVIDPNDAIVFNFSSKISNSVARDFFFCEEDVLFKYKIKQWSSSWLNLP